MARTLQKASKQAERGNQSKGICKKKRDIIFGFWIGLAGAAVYVNNIRKPAITPSKESKQEPVSTGTGRSTSGGLSFVPPALDLTASPLSNVPPASTVPPTTLQTSPAVTSTNAGSKQRDFLEIARKTGTDKVWGANTWPQCKDDVTKCEHPQMVNPKCRVLQGHFYHTMYNRWLGPYSADDAEPFQFLEIGHFQGKGFDAYKEFLPRAETHSIEIACLPEGPRDEGKWPWGNFPAVNPKYQEYLDTNQLHCGDGSDYNFLTEVWTQKMKRPGAPPLKVVIDDAAHIADHMAKSLLFWFPKIEPGGILVVEDVQPIPEANLFRTNVVPQVLKDLHYCGDPNFQDKPCFPTIWKLLHSVHCEMHICVFERNNLPSVNYSNDELALPPNTLNGAECLLRSSPA